MNTSNKNPSCLSSKQNSICLSSASWSFSVENHPFSINIYSYQKPSAPEQTYQEKNLSFVGSTSTLDPLYTSDLVYQAQTNPKEPKHSIQLQEQSEYLIEVLGKTQKSKFEIFCFPDLAPPILRKNPRSTKGLLFAGRLHFRDYVGTAQLQVKSKQQVFFSTFLEVRPKKLHDRAMYKAMLKAIADQRIALLLRMESPVSTSLYLQTSQIKPFGVVQFLILKHLLLSESFSEAIETIARQPIERIKPNIELVRTQRHPPRHARDLSKSQHHRHYIQPKNNATLQQYLPDRYLRTSRTMTKDCPENRYLIQFFKELLALLQKLEVRFKKNVSFKQLNSLKQLQEHVSKLQKRLPFLEEIQTQGYQQFPQQHLSRYPGYQQIVKLQQQLQGTLELQQNQFEQALQGPLHSLSKLYESWCFFELAISLNELTKTNTSLDEFLKHGNQTPSFQIPKASQTGISFHYQSLQITLYNQPVFRSGTKGERSSYSVTFTPDYSLEIKHSRGNQYLICFDAKYRPESSLEKMHAYRDAIQNAIGCYLFYPGQQKEPNLYHPEHPIPLSGVGAFPLRPRSNTRIWLKAFLSVLFDQIIQSAENEP